MPLSGLGVVVLIRFLTRPLCSMLLADRGAEVIKFTGRASGDSYRCLPGTRRPTMHKGGLAGTYTPPATYVEVSAAFTKTTSIGQAFTEHLVYDQQSGQLLSGSLTDYGLPRADEVCCFEMDENPVPTKTSPLGVKGAGEAGNVGALAVIMNAVIEALGPLGIAHLDMPATPEKVRRAIRGRSYPCCGKPPAPPSWGSPRAISSVRCLKLESLTLLPADSPPWVGGEPGADLRYSRSARFSGLSSTSLF